MEFHHLVADEPTNHLDADLLGWLRTSCACIAGGLVVTATTWTWHDVAVIKCGSWMPCAPGRCLQIRAGAALRRATDEQRRTRERANAERKAALVQNSRRMPSVTVPRSATCCAAPIG